jgi:hypothetical protein
VLIRRVCAPQTGDVRTYVDPVTGTAAYHTPMGRFVHVLPNTPLADQVTTVETPWWMDGQYQIGSLSQVRARGAAPAGWGPARRYVGTRARLCVAFGWRVRLTLGVTRRTYGRSSCSIH